MSTINPMSGEQMVLSSLKTNYELPPLGYKDFAPNHSWLEQKQIQSSLDHRKTLLDNERVEKENNLMLAEWIPEKLKAAVSRMGKHWETFGHHSDSTDWLYPEEALFLMEMNCLQCLYGEVPLSIQKGYSVLLNPENGCSLTEYRVFGYLCRAGYRVIRHLPSRTVTPYERTIRLDQHLNKRKTYDDMINTEEEVSEETVTEKTQALNKQNEIVTEKTQLLNKPEEMVLDNSLEMDKAEEMVTGKTQDLKKTVTNCIGELTKRKLWKIQRKNAKLRDKFVVSLHNVCNIKKLQALEILRRRKFHRIVGKYKKQNNRGTSRDQNRAYRNADSERNVLKDISLTSDGEDDTPEIPSERWQPPVVITDLPENIEITMGATPIQAEEKVKEQAAIEVIDIADTSSEEEQDSTNEVDSDSDIEIIQEIRLPAQNKDSEGEESEDDDLEIIEVPVPKKEIPVETLSSDNEEENGEEEESGSESERSYDGNWKRDRANKRTKFVRPPTMSHLTCSAVEEFCLEKKLPKANVNSEDSSNRDGNDSTEFIRLEASEPRNKRPMFIVEKTRNEILDLMPTMAGQNRKLMTLDSPDLRLIPDSVIPKQPSYTFSTNALRARVFRQGFRGRRNFHGPRFTSFNPYYNNTNENFFSNQIGRFQGLFQPPQMSQMLGGGDINSVARGVMQIASALLMNLPQNNMSNGILYNPRPHFPLMNSNLSQIDAPNPTTPQFPVVSRNFYNEQSNMNPQGFNIHQRNNTDYQHLFDMPQQRNFGTPNHIRFPDNSSSPIVENHQNFNMDLTRSSESDFDSSDHNFTPRIGNGHRAGRNFRNNRAANFRSKRGKFKRQRGRGGFPLQVSRRGSSNHSQLIDPAYIKPDVPIPGEQNSVSQGIADFIPVSSSNSNQKSVEVISIDDNDDGFIPKLGISSKFINKAERKRRNRKRNKEKAKRNRPNQNLGGVRDPEIVFLDSPTASRPSNESMSDSVKQENETTVLVKTETENNLSTVKIEEIETTVAHVKQESAETSLVKAENEVETRVKMERANHESSGVRVKVEQGGSGQNVKVEIKIESSSDTSSVVSLPLANLVKEEPSQMKLESVERSEVKSEAVDVIDSVKTESVDEQECKEGILKAMEKNNKVHDVGEASERTQSDPMDTSASEFERTNDSENENVLPNRTDGNLETVVERESREVCGDVSCSRTDLTSEDKNKNVSSWAEVKKAYRLLNTYQETESEDESEDDEDEIRPILRPKHCKTIGTVLSALQIFTPFNSPPPGDVLRLKISFDLYLPTESRKSYRGLPQYRIVVFSGTEPVPSPAQLREVSSRYQDGVPVLTAVVSPSGVTFYIFSDIDLPQDTCSYSK